MSRTLFNKNIFTSINLSSTNTTSSLPVPIYRCEGFALQGSISTVGGALTGTIVVQGSNDQPNNPAQASYTLSNWTPITGTLVSLNGSNQAFGLEVHRCFYGHMRVVYTNVAGSGSLNTLRVQGKGK